MSDLDDLAKAASGGGTRGRQPASPQAKPGKPAQAVKPAAPRVAPPPPEDDRIVYEYEGPPPAGGVSPKAWIALGAGIVIVLALAFWIINRDRGAAPRPLAQGPSAQGAKGAATKPAAAAALPTTGPARSPSAAAGAAGAASPGGSGAAAQAPAPRAPGALKDIEDPTEAVEVYHLTRDGDILDIRVRNISRRGVYVKVLQFYAESDDTKPIGESIRFWLAPGMPLVATHEMPRLSDRLGEEEGVIGVVEEAEFADAMPEELKELAAAEKAEASPADEQDDEDENEEEPAPTRGKGKSKKKPADE